MSALLLLLAACTAAHVKSDTSVETSSDSSGDTSGDTAPPCTDFPADNPWNTDISGYPVHPSSEAWMASLGLDGHLHPDFGTVWQGAPIGIPYNEVTPSTEKVLVALGYAEESDPGPYPIPPDPLVEGGSDATGDRHVLMVDHVGCKLYELWNAWPPGQGPYGAPDTWSAGSGAIFDLTSNALRPDYWTSADAAGLPIYPGLARYDEVVEVGLVDHALRFTASQTQRAFIHPATHFASSSTDPDLPPMGMRVRMKSTYDCSAYSSEVQVLCTALKAWGLLLADNGSDWFISGAPDSRWSDDRLGDLKKIPGSAFEAVDTGPLIY